MSSTEAGTRVHGGLAAEALRRVRARIRAVAVGEKLLAGAGGVLAWLLGAGLLDYLFRLPGWVRLIMLGVGVSLLAAAVVRRLVPVWRLRPRLSTIALRLEQTALGRERGLAGVLASGVALGSTTRTAGDSSGDLSGDTRSDADGGEPESMTALREAAAKRADEAMRGAKPWSLVDLRAFRRRAAWAAAIAIAAVAIAGTSPTSAGTGFLRQIAPLGSAEWPKRYAVVDATAAEVHPIGASLPIRGLVTRTSRDLGETPVIVAYRVIDAEGVGPWRREPMTPQRTLESTSEGELGEAFERLVDAAVTLGDDGEPATLEYAIETPDDRTAPASILLTEQPDVVGLTALVTPPAYASSGGGSGFLAGEIELGVGAGSRRILGPVLAGSTVTVDATLNKPAMLADERPVTGAAPDAASIDAAISNAGPSMTLTWTAETSARVTLALEDDFGLTSLEDVSLRLDVVDDEAPTSVVTAPPRDESVLATAVIAIEAEGRDDVSLRWVGIEYERALLDRDSEPSPGVGPESDGKPIGLAQVETTEPSATATASLDLSTLGVRAGDAIDVFGLAADRYERGGTTHDVVRSDPRRLRIIDESELIDEILAELGAVRRSAIRLDEQQAEIEASLRSAREAGGPIDAALRTEQANVGEGLDRAADLVQRVAERIERNALDDASLGRVISEASAASDEGVRAAERAAENIRTLNDRDAGDDETDARKEAELSEALESSDDVRRSLEQLARVLDQGEDAWAVRRSLEGILQDQQELAEATAEATAGTVGRSADELTEQERSILDEIARRQLDLADRTSEALDDLDERAEQADDAGQGAAMRAASRRGREQGVSQLQREAGEAAAQNRGAEAGRAQQQAQEQIEEMLRDLETAEQQRDVELQRALLSLVETIEGLIRTQESALASLARVVDDGPADGLAGALADALADLAPDMQRLHRNTLSAQDEARADRSLAPVAAALDVAGRSQVEAVVDLRSADAEGARANETTSLTQLRLALEAAEDALEDAERRETERRRAELQSAYRELLEEQVEISSQTLPLIDRRLTRRERAGARGLAGRESAVADQLEFLTETYPEIAEAGVIDFAHTRLAEKLGGVEASLRSGEIDAGVPLQQGSIESLLRGLIASLEPAEPNEQDNGFDEGGGGSGSGSGQGEARLIPDLAQLTMLRTMQQDIYDRTRQAEEAGIGGDLAGSLGSEQRGVAEQARQLLEKMQEQMGQGGAPAPAPTEPNDPESAPGQVQPPAGGNG
ncbi:MAG: hypothetical protein AAFR96_02040 [Planctomycetota bacterium]